METAVYRENVSEAADWLKQALAEYPERWAADSTLDTAKRLGKIADPYAPSEHRETPERGLGAAAAGNG